MITEFPLLVFTTLTGIAAGAYVFAALFPSKETPKNPWLFPLVALVLVGVGSLAAVAHLGRPQLVFGVLNNPTATLTMEGIFAGLLAVVAVVDLIVAATKKEEMRAVRIVGAVVGVVLLCIVTMAYTTSYGNPAWTAMPTWPLFVLGGLTAGAGLWGMLRTEKMTDKRFAVVACVVAVLFAAVLVWQAVVFAGLGQGIALLVIGALAALAAGIVAYHAAQYTVFNAGTICLVLAVIALCVSRYAFYAASII